MASVDQLSSEVVELVFWECIEGEILENSECKVCNWGTYSFEKSSNTCSLCMKNAECQGGLSIVVDEGFWRASNTSENIYQCLSRSSCHGGYVENSLIPVECKEGYTGPLCQVCTFYEEEKYMWQGPDGCAKCPNKIENAFTVLSLILVYAFYIGMLIFINIRKKKASNLSILMKILSNYF